jgi:hypothetical protein
VAEELDLLKAKMWNRKCTNFQPYTVASILAKMEHDSPFTEAEFVEILNLLYDALVRKVGLSISVSQIFSVDTVQSSSILGRSCRQPENYKAVDSKMQGDEDELFDESALSKMLWSTEFKSGIM